MPGLLWLVLSMSRYNERLKGIHFASFHSEEQKAACRNITKQFCPVGYEAHKEFDICPFAIGDMVTKNIRRPSDMGQLWYVAGARYIYLYGGWHISICRWLEDDESSELRSVESFRLRKLEATEEQRAYRQKHIQE